MDWVAPPPESDADANPDAEPDAEPDADPASRLAALRWARDDIRARIELTKSNRDAAALHLRYADVLEQIEALERAAAPTVGTSLDELAARRRASRRPNAATVTVPAGQAD